MAGRLANIQSQVKNYGQVVEWNIDKFPHELKPVGRWNGAIHLVESALDKPFKWTKPRTIFVCSMSDLFHKSVPFEWISKVFSITQKCPQHTFLILTKRPEIMQKYFNYTGIRYPYLNVWLGVTAENQEQADKRIPILLSIPSKKRFVSIEPMLGPVDLNNEWGAYQNGNNTPFRKKIIEGLDWVLCGAESGPGRREMQIPWAIDLKDQCVEAGVPFFFKQKFENGKKQTMPILDGQIWDQRP